jgi:hypothetical protein
MLFSTVVFTSLLSMIAAQGAPSSQGGSPAGGSPAGGSPAAGGSSPAAGGSNSGSGSAAPQTMNIQPFTGIYIGRISHLGTNGGSAPGITYSGKSATPFLVDGESFSDYISAVSRQDELILVPPLL